jgi:hypothetical protein
VREFIDELSLKERAAVIADITLLRNEGPVLPFPWTSDIRAYRGLRELRTRFGGSQLRVIYTINSGKVVLLHAFRKSSSSRLSNELATASRRMRSL